MAITAEEQTSIVQLVVGMAGVAPRPEDLADLVAEFEAGSSLVQIAQNIVDHPAYSGDAGLFPNYLPNSVWATQYLTMLIGAEVSEEDLDAAIAATTADLNAGSTRAEVSVAAIDGLAAETPAVGYEDAAAALANKTEVAEYYAINSEAVDDNIANMAAAISAVDSGATAAAAGIAAVDAVIAGAQPLTLLINNLDDANDAITAFLAPLDLDDNPLTKTTEADVNAEEGVVAGLVDAAAVAAGGLAAGTLTAASHTLQTALISDQKVANAGTLLGLGAGAAASAKLTAAVAGLDSAISTHLAALDAKDDADDAALLSDAALTEQLVAHGISDGAVTVGGANPIDATFTVAAELIIGPTLAGTSLEIKPGFNEITNPGITALLSAALTDFGAYYAANVTTPAQITSSLEDLENLDLTAARGVALKAADDVMNFITAAKTDKPTNAELAAEQTALNAGTTQLKADIAAIVTFTADGDHVTAVTNLAAAAVTGNFLSAAQETALISAFDLAGTGTITDDATLLTAVTDAITALNVTNVNPLLAGSASESFEVLTAAVIAESVGSLDATETPLAFDKVADALAVAAQLTTDGLLAGFEADLEAAYVNEASLKALNDVVDDAEDAFGDAGFGLPTTLDSAVKAASLNDDVFLQGGIDSQILSFGASGDDQLFIGADLTLNTDSKAGDNGDNSVLEVWITGTTNAVITVETSVFGSEAETPETFTITLTGVAAADVSFDGGIITV